MSREGSWSRYAAVGVLCLLLGTAMFFLERISSAAAPAAAPPPDTQPLPPQPPASGGNTTGPPAPPAPTPASATSGAAEIIVYCVAAFLVLCGAAALCLAGCMLHREAPIVIVPEAGLGLPEAYAERLKEPEEQGVHEQELGPISVGSLAAMGVLSDSDYLPAAVSGGTATPRLAHPPAVPTPSCTVSICDPADVATDADDFASRTATPSSLSASISALPAGLPRPPRRHSRVGGRNRPRRHSAVSHHTSEATQGLIFA